MRLSIFVFLAVIFIACNSTGSEPGEEIVRIGNWDVNITQLKADYVGPGGQNKSKISTIQSQGDTIFVDTPEGVSLRLSHYVGIAQQPHESFDGFFIDSTITEGEYKKIVLDSAYIDIYGAYSSGVTNSGYIGASFGGTYSCDHDTINFEYLNFSVLTISDTTTYSFDVAGMSESLERIVCIYD